MALFVAQQAWHCHWVVPGRHQCAVASEQLGKSTAFVDRKIVDDWLHGKRDRRFQPALGCAHNCLQPGLCLLFDGWVKDKAHATAGHPAQHPEAPKLCPKLRLHLLDQTFGIKIAGPRNNRLDWAVKIAVGGGANRRNITPPQ